MSNTPNEEPVPVTPIPYFQKKIPTDAQKEALKKAREAKKRQRSEIENKINYLYDEITKPSKVAKQNEIASPSSSSSLGRVLSTVSLLALFIAAQGVTSYFKEHIINMKRDNSSNENPLIDDRR